LEFFAPAKLLCTALRRPGGDSEGASASAREKIGHPAANRNSASGMKMLSRNNPTQDRNQEQNDKQKQQDQGGQRHAF
jgi:hypothetical protein